MVVKSTLMKYGRDLAVLLVATAAVYVSENYANFGLPEEIAPVVGATSLLIYRLARPVVKSTA